MSDETLEEIIDTAEFWCDQVNSVDPYQGQETIQEGVLAALKMIRILAIKMSQEKP